jgi:two-component system, chemotaxis family, response regulator PixG
MERLTVDQLVHQFQVNHRSHYTGRVDLQLAKGECWSLYFQLGRLVWATGGVHRFRRWYRSLSQFCPEISPTGIRLRETEASRIWEYLVLTVLIKRQRIRLEQAVMLIQHSVNEVLFDILQGIDEVTHLTYVSENSENIGEPLTLINAEQILLRAQLTWETWRNANLAPYSPNLAPILRRTDELQKQTTASTYKTLKSLVNGTSTLRDIAVLIKQNPLTVARSLLPYAHRGLIGFQEITDIALPEAQEEIAIGTPKAPARVPAHQPLIICIDDSFQVCQAVNQILTPAGYRFASIQDSMQALPTLIELKPSLIFLDLMMPVANGYEICMQVRRVSVLKDIPIVILTGKDGIVDRVRAKLVGASDYLAKPVEADKVLAMVSKHLKVKAPQPKPSDDYEMGDTTALMLKESLMNS